MVATDGAEATGATTATVDGAADAEGQSTTLYVDYALASEPWCTSGGTNGSPDETTPRTLSASNVIISEISVGLGALTPGSEYCAELVAHNESGTAYGGQRQFTTPLSSSPREAQTEPAESTPTGFKLKGKLNPENSPTSYYFIYKKVGEVECEDLEGCGLETAHGGPLTGDTQQEVPPMEVTGLTPGTTYVYWLIARNVKGTVRGRELTFVTPAGWPPSEVVTEPAEATSTGYKLEGKLNPEGLPTTYYYEYGSATCDELPDCKMRTEVVGPITGDTQQEAPAVEVSGLTSGDTYWYRLVASNADGTADGAIAMFTVQPEAQSGSGGQAKGEPLLVVPLSTISPQIVKTTTKPKLPTREQKLAKALKACRAKPRKRRASCEKLARKKYGRVTKKGKK